MKIGLKTGLFTGTRTGEFPKTQFVTVPFTGVILNKSPNSGSFGFFRTLETKPKDYTGKSGTVELTYNKTASLNSPPEDRPKRPLGGGRAFCFNRELSESPKGCLLRIGSANKILGIFFCDLQMVGK